jgi:hypothetical protein
MREIKYQADICVIGGGIAGICAAVAAARHGARVALLHDRPVLGGNASSEIRMWICGAQGGGGSCRNDLLETGIVEEIRLKNMYRNPRGIWSIWDSVLYEIVKQEPNIKLFQNCTCVDAQMDENTIRSIKGWQMTTESWITVDASLFVDSSGDAILAPLTGAEFRIGREARDEFNESIQPETADKKTMGMSCLIQTRETDSLKPFIPPEWAKVYETDEELNNRNHTIGCDNFWWIELGGDNDSIHDTEEIKDELLSCAFGIWDHMKNRGDHGADNWQLEWIGFLPGKRESRRYIGDHILNQNDVRAEGRFDDLVAYGGWSMDDHHPAGLKHNGEPTIFHEAPSPYGFPYRSLYSVNIENLMFAGRNISATHAALSSTRVMATCGVIGQAVGTAAAIATRTGLSPREVGEQHITRLQQQLMADDCYLPWNKRILSDLTREAELTASNGADAEPLRDGIGRTVNGQPHHWAACAGDFAEYRWAEPQPVQEIQITFDSDLSRGTFGKTSAANMPCLYPLDFPEQAPPETLVKAFRIEALDDQGQWVCVLEETGHYQRLFRKTVDLHTTTLRLRIDATWGNEVAKVYEWEVR